MKKYLKAIMMGSAILMLTFSGSAFAQSQDAYTQEDYDKKVKTNNDTIGVIAGVINYVCPKLIPADEAGKICNAQDPVGSAVGVQKQMLGSSKDIDDVDEEDMKKRVLKVEAAYQFYDAVEQFKAHYPHRANAEKAAKKKDWKTAALEEEMAWQYLVKCASRGIFSKKMVDGQ